MCDGMLTGEDVAKFAQKSVSTGYSIIAKLNRELRNEGYATISGRVPKSYFFKRYNIKEG